MEYIQTHKAEHGKCSACGTAPVNHKLFYIEGFMTNIMDGVSKVMFGWIPVSPENKIVDTFMAGFVNLFRLLGLAKFSEDVTKVASGRSELIWN